MQTHPFEVPDTPVIPVVSLDRAEQAVPLARELVAGGVTMLEITLRAPAGLESIRRISAEVPEMRVGAGTVTRSHEFELVRAAGARLAFSPGFSPTLSGAAMRAGVQFIPGVMTPSEAVAAADAGHVWLKLFPAAAAGGVAMLRSLAAPLPRLRFCPAGGVDAGNAGAYLAVPNVFAVSATWLTPATALANGDWERVTALAREARRIAGREPAPRRARAT